MSGDSKILFAESNGVFRILTKQITKGKIVLAKTAKLNVGDLKNSLIEVPQKFPFRGYKFFPLYMAKWNSCMPFDLATIKPQRKLKLVKVVTTSKYDMPKGKKLLSFMATKNRKNLGKPISITKVEDVVGTLEWHELKLEEPPAGAKMLTPENYNNIYKNVALETLMTTKKNEQIPMLWLLIGVGLGFFIAFSLFNVAFPHGVQAALEAANQAIANAAGAPQ